jgi:hypothetical protein
MLFLAEAFALNYGDIQGAEVFGRDQPSGDNSGDACGGKWPSGDDDLVEAAAEVTGAGGRESLMETRVMPDRTGVAWSVVERS